MKLAEVLNFSPVALEVARKQTFKMTAMVKKCQAAIDICILSLNSEFQPVALKTVINGSKDDCWTL